MTDAVIISMPGKPRGKQRPRMTRAGHAYTPHQTRVQEATVKTLAIDAMQGRSMLEGPVEIVLTAVMEIPVSWSRKKREAAMSGALRPTGKPDLDNVLKLFSDSINGIVYRDDSQIVRATIEKWYGPASYTVATVRAAEMAAAA